MGASIPSGPLMASRRRRASGCSRRLDRRGPGDDRLRADRAPRARSAARRGPAAAGGGRDRATARASRRACASSASRSPTSAACGSPRWRRLQVRLAPVDRLLARQEAMEQTIATEIDERPTGDADTDRLLERDPRRGAASTRMALASLRAGGVPRLEPARARGRAAGPPRADPRPRALAPRARAAGSPARSTAPTTASPPCSGSSPASRGRPAGRTSCSPPGLFGAIGSALSMATGAYLAERSTPEVAAANLAREREEVLAHPEEEKEELSLFYQLKGLTEAEADMIVERIAQDPEKLFAGDRDRGARKRDRRSAATRSRPRSPAGSRRRSARSSRCCRSSGSPATPA